MTMFHNTRKSHSSRHQRGAALIVGLLLLTIITLLAIAGMNSASIELVMAGNTQYHQRAFQASESGIEDTFMVNPLPPSVKDAAGTVIDKGLMNVTIASSSPDKYTTSLTMDSDNGRLATNNSALVFTMLDYTVRSVGTSARNARTTHTQGLAILAPGAGGPVRPGPGADPSFK
jgi:Tfp pilus assembly protein PilX